MRRFTNGILLHRASGRPPDSLTTGAASFKRWLGCEQNPSQERDSPEHPRRYTTPCSLGLVLQATCCEQLRSPPAAVAPERHRPVRHSWLAMLLHPSLAHDGEGSCNDTGEGEKACENDLGIHSVGKSQPNGWRLSCGATLEWSQTECYYSVLEGVYRIDWRRAPTASSAC